MGYIPLEIILISAEVFKNVNFFSKMHLYTTVTLLGDSSASKKKKTTVDEHSGSKPFWWFRMNFLVDESKLLQNNLTLLFHVKCRRNFGDKNIGFLHLPVKELYDSSANQNYPTNAAYTINSQSSGKPSGILYLSYMFIGQSHQIIQTSGGFALPSAPPALSSSPSAPYIAEDNDDNEYYFSPNSNNSAPSFAVDEYGFGSTTPSAPYLPVDHGISSRTSSPTRACLQDERQYYTNRGYD